MGCRAAMKNKGCLLLRPLTVGYVPVVASLLTNIVYFTYLPRSPRWSDRHQICSGGRLSGHNELCQISFQSVHGFWFSRGSKFGLSHRNEVSPLTQGLNYRSACDVWHKPLRSSPYCPYMRYVGLVYTVVQRHWYWQAENKVSYQSGGKCLYTRTPMGAPRTS